MSAPRPVDESVLIDLKERLREFRRVPLAEGVGWSRGTDSDYLTELVYYWAETYYWREHEERILDYPWVHTGSGDPGLRAIHQVAGADAPTVVLLHGWPDSFLRFERVLPLLTDVNVVVPCLPGFPYAEPLTEPGMSTAAMADAVVAAWLSWVTTASSSPAATSGVRSPRTSAMPMATASPPCT